MSNMRPLAGNRPPGLPTPPRGEPIARYATYLEAQRAVDHLSDNHFPVQFVTIVGTDLRMVERVTGRLSYGRVAFYGLASGAWFGVFVGLLLTIFSSGQSLVLVAAIVIGAGFGMLFGVGSYALTGGRRDFTSQSQIVASEYQVLCMAEHAQRARELLIQLERTPMPAGMRPEGRSGPGVYPPGGPPPTGPPSTSPPSTSPPSAGGESYNPYGLRPPGSYPPAGDQPGYPPGTYPPPPSGAVNPYGTPGAATPPPPPGAPQPPGASDTPSSESQPSAPPVTGLTYGEVMEQRRREQRERELRERHERAERAAAAQAEAQSPEAQSPEAQSPEAQSPEATSAGGEASEPSSWREPGSSPRSDEPEAR